MTSRGDLPLLLPAMSPAAFISRVLLTVFLWLVATGLLVVAFRLLGEAFAQESLLVALVYAPPAMGCLIVAGLCVAPSFIGLAARQVGGFFGSLFYPEEYHQEPPTDLLKSLRMRIRDRMFWSVEQQLVGLQSAYPPHPAVYHLLAVNLAAQQKDWKHIVSDAVRVLSRRQFARFQELVRIDPPSPLD